MGFKYSDEVYRLKSELLLERARNYDLQQKLSNISGSRTAKPSKKLYNSIQYTKRTVKIK